MHRKYVHIQLSLVLTLTSYKTYSPHSWNEIFICLCTAAGFVVVCELPASLNIEVSTLDHLQVSYLMCACVCVCAPLLPPSTHGDITSVGITNLLE